MNVKTKKLGGTPFTLTLSLKNRIAFSLFLKSAGHSGETRSFQRHGAVPRPDPAGRRCWNRGTGGMEPRRIPMA